jgi:hypothetical protein
MPWSIMSCKPPSAGTTLPAHASSLSCVRHGATWCHKHSDSVVTVLEIVAEHGNGCIVLCNVTPVGKRVGQLAD